MKRLICLTMICVIMLGLFASNAAENIYIPHDEIPMNETSADILSNLGILKGDENGYGLDRNVTRAEAITMIFRVNGIKSEPIETEAHFKDTIGHWASDIIEYAYRNGYVSGRSEFEFDPDPDSIVTGKEFVKMMLAVMGYSDITIENAYDKGAKSGLLSDNFTKSAVFNDYILKRNDVISICHTALITNLPNGIMLYKMLIEKGLYTESDFDILYCGLNPDFETTSKSVTLEDGYFKLFCEIFGDDPALNEDIKYLVLDLSNIKLSKTDGLIEHFENFCNENNLILLLDDIDGLVEKGYINDLRFYDGIVIAFKDKDVSEDSITTEVSKWRSGTGAIGVEYKAIKSHNEWKVEETGNMWIS